MTQRSLSWRTHPKKRQMYQWLDVDNSLRNPLKPHGPSNCLYRPRPHPPTCPSKPHLCLFFPACVLLVVHIHCCIRGRTARPDFTLFPRASLIAALAGRLTSWPWIGSDGICMDKMERFRWWASGCGGEDAGRTSAVEVIMQET